MKKIIALILTVACVFALGACGNTNAPAGDNAGSTGSTATYASAEEVMTKVFDVFSAEVEFFGWGGNMENMVDGKPATFDVSLTEEMTANLIVPADLVGSVDDAANLMHGMNLNMFTSAAFHVADTAAFAEGYEAAIKSNQWMCGAPETFAIIDAGNGYVVTVFGAADLVSAFEGAATTALEGSTVLSSGAVVE